MSIELTSTKDYMKYAMGRNTFLAIASEREDDDAGSGFLNWGTHRVNAQDKYGDPVNDGLWASAANRNTFFMGCGTRGDDIQGDSETTYPIFRLKGVEIHMISSGTPGAYLENKIILPLSPDGMDKIADGTRYPDIAAAITAGGNTLSTSVISRSDLTSLEIWYEEVSDTGCFYPYGNVQFKDNDWMGLSLSTVNVSQGYSAFGSWDTSSTGNCIKLSIMTTSQIKQFIQDPRNNVFQYDGILVQVRWRIRTETGVQDVWSGVDPESTLVNTLHCVPGSDFVGQGKLQSPVGLGGNSYTYLNKKYMDNNGHEHVRGVASVLDPAGNIAWEGKCYLAPLFIATRRNQGAYHPIYNTVGCNMFQNVSLAIRTSTPTNGHKFFDTESYIPISLADCFTYGAEGKGTIISSASGRPYEETYDSVHANDIQDLRMSCRSKTNKEVYDEYTAKALRNEVRGFEGYPFTNIIFSAQASAIGTTGTNIYLRFPKGTFQTMSLDGRLNDDEVVGDIVDSNGKPYEVVCFRDDASYEYLYLHRRYGSSQSWRSLISISGVTKGCGFKWIQSRSNKPMMIGITGDPAEILGWAPAGVEGRWLPVVPDGTRGHYYWPRKLLSSSFRFKTVNGTHWNVISDWVPVLVTGHREIHNNVGYYELYPYITDSKCTTFSDMSKHYHKDKLHMVSGGDLDTPGQRLMMSLTDSVPRSTSATVMTRETQELISTGIDQDRGILAGSSYHGWCTHPYIKLAITSGEYGCKLLPYLSKNASKFRLDIIFNELRWDYNKDHSIDFISISYTDVTSKTAGNYYLVTNGPLAGTWLSLSSSYRAIDTTQFRLQGDYLTDASGTLFYKRWNGRGWGDDEKLHIANKAATRLNVNDKHTEYGNGGFDTHYFTPRQ